MNYKIEVHSVGYEDTAKVVDVASLREARRFVRDAIIEWCEHNELDFDGNWEMPFTRVTKISL